jgi:hypothetical protein
MSNKIRFNFSSLPMVGSTAWHGYIATLEAALGRKLSRDEYRGLVRKSNRVRQVGKVKAIRLGKGAKIGMAKHCREMRS